MDLPEEYEAIYKDHLNWKKFIFMVVGPGRTWKSYSQRRGLTQNTITINYALVLLYILYTNFGSDADIDALKHRLYDYNPIS